MSDTLHGQCLCGAVTVAAEPMPTLQACHCDRCRTWGGGPFLSIPCKSAEFSGPVTRFESSEHAARGFCPTCGTHLYFHALAVDVYAVPAGLFSPTPDIPLKAELFVDQRPGTYAFDGAARQMTGAEYRAKFR